MAQQIEMNQSEEVDQLVVYWTLADPCWLPSPLLTLALT